MTFTLLTWLWILCAAVVLSPWLIWFTAAAFVIGGPGMIKDIIWKHLILWNWE